MTHYGHQNTRRTDHEQPRPLIGAAWARTRDLRQSMDEVIHDVVGHTHQDATDVRIEKLEEILQPIYKALPKNAKNALDPATVRYLLHRYFVKEYAMYIKGLQPSGDAWNSTSPAMILKDRIPMYIQQLFEQNLHGSGFKMHEVAIFAATIEHVLHTDSNEKLKRVYELSNFSLNSNITHDQLATVMYVFFLETMTNADTSSWTVEHTQELVEATSMDRHDDDWPMYKEFLDKLRTETTDRIGALGSTVTFQDASKVVQSFIRDFGRFQDNGCRIMQKTLASAVDAGPGRLKLSTFYNLGMSFREKSKYLDRLGVLDASVASTPRVMVANYMNSETNCIASTSFYSVCCIDQCEGLLGQIEASIVAPHATPRKLVALVKDLPSSTVSAPRLLSDSLISKLDSIAAANGGQVPLHGRLFAQWLHHAYPNECAFPNPIGARTPLTSAEWLTLAEYTEQEKARYTQDSQVWELTSKVKDLSDGDLAETLPWLEAEELVAHHKGTSLGHELHVVFRGLALVGMLSFVCLHLSKTIAAGSEVLGAHQKLKPRTP